MCWNAPSAWPGVLKSDCICGKCWAWGCTCAHTCVCPGQWYTDHTTQVHKSKHRQTFHTHPRGHMHIFIPAQNAMTAVARWNHDSADVRMLEHGVGTSTLHCDLHLGHFLKLQEASPTPLSGCFWCQDEHGSRIKQNSSWAFCFSAPLTTKTRDWVSILMWPLTLWSKSVWKSGWKVNLCNCCSLLALWYLDSSGLLHQPSVWHELVHSSISGAQSLETKKALRGFALCDYPSGSPRLSRLVTSQEYLLSGYQLVPAERLPFSDFLAHLGGHLFSTGFLV